VKLADLQPAWVTKTGRVIGVRFTCPCCHGCQVGVLFANPPDGGAPHPNDPQCVGNNDGERWDREGDTFDDLTLRPSIDGSPSHWHGFVTKGEIA
jgi:hypothetical protein